MQGMRYVILEHDHPVLHWDLMLEAGEVLWTWRVAATPRPGAHIQADPLPDHRLMYLDYEGPVSGNRGRVVRWDFGTFTSREENADRIVLSLSGQRLQGTLTLRRVSTDRWDLSWEVAPERGN